MATLILITWKPHQISFAYKDISTLKISKLIIIDSHCFYQTHFIFHWKVLSVTLKTTSQRTISFYCLLWLIQWRTKRKGEHFRRKYCQQQRVMCIEGFVDRTWIRIEALLQCRFGMSRVIVHSPGSGLTHRYNPHVWIAYALPGEVTDHNIWCSHI